MRNVAPILIAALAACRDPSAPVLGFDREPILGGSKTIVGQFPTVVAVFETKASSLCTGTLISPTIVLTAAHCVDPNTIGRTAPEIVAEMEVFFDTLDVDHTQPANIVHATQILENPAHPNFAQAMPDLGHDDDALIVLDTPQTTRATSAVDLSAANILGVTTTQVGYGISSGMGSAGTEFYLTGKSVVDCSIAGPNMLDSNLICFNEQNGKGQCSGDSGGPASSRGYTAADCITGEQGLAIEASVRLRAGVHGSFTRHATFGADGRQRRHAHLGFVDEGEHAGPVHSGVAPTMSWSSTHERS